MLEEALRKGEFIEFLRGDNGYMVEKSEFSPGPRVTDTSEILMEGIYKEYKENEGIKRIFEQGLLKMLDMMDFDVYMVCLYLLDYYFDITNDLWVFKLDNIQKILDKFKREIGKRKVRIQKYGVEGPNNYKYKYAWEDLKMFKEVCAEDYNIELF